ANDLKQGLKIVDGNKKSSDVGTSTRVCLHTLETHLANMLKIRGWACRNLATASLLRENTTSNPRRTPCIASRLLSFTTKCTYVHTIEESSVDGIRGGKIRERPCSTQNKGREPGAQQRIRKRQKCFSVHIFGPLPSSDAPEWGLLSSVARYSATAQPCYSTLGRSYGLAKLLIALAVQTEGSSLMKTPEAFTRSDDPAPTSAANNREAQNTNNPHAHTHNAPYDTHEWPPRTEQAALTAKYLRIH
ncbi:unnamed protein product, partial [Hapterophycus canaliculatus]